MQEVIFQLAFWKINIIISFERNNYIMLKDSNKNILIRLDLRRLKLLKWILETDGKLSKNSKDHRKNRLNFEKLIPDKLFFFLFFRS